MNKQQTPNMKKETDGKKDLKLFLSITFEKAVPSDEIIARRTPM